MSTAESAIEKRLREMGLTLPPIPPDHGAIYRPVVIMGDMAWVSGHGPLLNDGTLILGKLGRDMDVAGGQRAARQVALSMLASLKAALGSLDRIDRLVKTLGMVNSTPDFGDQPSVVNGFSQLMVDLLGPEKGMGARSSVGMGALPDGIPIEVECLFALRPAAK